MDCMRRRDLLGVLAGGVAAASMPQLATGAEGPRPKSQGSDAPCPGERHTAPDPRCLTTLAERNRYLLEQAVCAGDELYCPDMRLVRQCHEMGYFNGYTIGQVSLEYALALLETGGDAARAEGIVARTLDFQDLKEGSPTYGNFRWMAHWKDVRDRNAVTFMAPNYYFLWQRHARRLSPGTRARMKGMFEHARKAVDTHGASWTYTNIFLLKVVSWLMLGRIMKDDDLIRHATQQWDLWRRNTSRGGFCEFNSPCYAAVQLYALADLWQECGNPTWQRGIGEVLERLYTEFAANLHKGSCCLSGPASRAYPIDYLYGTGLSAVVAYQQFGLWHSGGWDSNGGKTPFLANFALSSYEVPETLRQAVAAERTEPYVVRSSIPETRGVAVNVVAPAFSLGSLSTDSLGRQNLPVVVCRRTDARRRTIPLHLTPPGDGEIFCHQRENRVLGWLRPTKRQTPAQALWLLGPWRRIANVRLDGIAWDGGPTERLGPLSLAIEIEGVALGLHVLPHDPESPLSLGIADEELVFTVPTSESGPVVFLQEVVDLATTDFGTFVERFDACRLTLSGSKEKATVADGTRKPLLELEVGALRAELRNPESSLFAVLHQSPYMTLRRGQL